MVRFLIAMIGLLRLRDDEGVTLQRRAKFLN